MRLFFRHHMLQVLCSGLASWMLLATWPAFAGGSKGLPNCFEAAPGQQCDPNASGPVPDPVPNWALSKVRYQRWANSISLSDIAEKSGLSGSEAADLLGLLNSQGMAGEMSYCMDRDYAAVCAMNCKVKVLSRKGLTQRSQVDCPDFQGTVDFVWAPDGLSWQMDQKMEPSADMPSGAGVVVRSRYLGPCTEKEALQDR